MSLIGLVGWLGGASLRGQGTLWTFQNSGDRLAASVGLGKLDYHDPDGTGWGPAGTAFGKASEFGLPALPGGDPDVMRFPACTGRQGYRVTHGAPGNGAYGETGAQVSNYTLVLDLLYPSSSDGQWRALYQTETNNTTEAEFFVQNTPSGGIGTIGVYHGSITPDVWHRVAIVMQSAPGEGKCQRFIDGRFVGGIGSTGSGLDSRWALAPAFLLFADNDGQTAPGYVSSVYFVDRALTMEEVQALGGPSADGANAPGAPALPITQQMPRPVGVIGHRGGFFCCAPDNTLAAVQRALDHQVPVIEIDTRLSADGVCVLMHDSTVDRTTDGTGTVVSKTVSQLKLLDAGSSFSPEFAGERVPTLAEVMALAKDRMILYFDLKVPGQIDAITNAIGQTGFNADDCWFWTYDSESDAASIRSRLPEAKIIWGDPPFNWASDPNFFTHKRAVGVYGFDLSVYYGTANAAFLRAAKQAGFIVSIYTILDPDTMVRNAAAGVDFMETDFPQIMQQIQPPQTAAASGPSPVDGAVDVSTHPLLTWVPGLGSTSHRVYFGPSPDPEFLREQTYDLVPLADLTPGATYYWRVDEQVPEGTLAGPVWSFTVTFNPPPAFATYEWNFEDGTLAPSLGNGRMEYADGATAGLVAFGVTDGVALPHPDGQPAAYLYVPALTGSANGIFLHFFDTLPNGGGAYINQFSLIMDLLVPGPLNWTALFNTNVENANDADFYVDPTGSLGIGDLGYSAAGTVAANTWSRVAFTADLSAGTVAYYRNGAQVFQTTRSGLLDGRFSLYSVNDLLPSLFLFNEGDTSGVYTHALYASAISFTDRAMTTGDVAALGGPQAEGIFVRRLHIEYDGSRVVLRWNGAANMKLQKATRLANPDWNEVPETLGASSFTEESPSGLAVYRLLRE